MLNSGVPQFESWLCLFPGTGICTIYLANMDLSFSNCSVKIIRTFKNADGIRKDKNIVFLACYMLDILVI